MRIVLLVTALLTLPAAAQSPTDLVRQALDAAESAKHSATRFTNFDLEHNQNRDRNGHLFADRTTLYEDTWIAGLPYKRVVEIDGHPLTGDDLAHEQARYDQAVADRKGLDAIARARLIHEKIIDPQLNMSALLTPAYTLTELRAESLPQPSGPPLLTHVIEAVPTDKTATKRFQLWITEHDPTILRMTFDVVQDEPNMLHGSTGRNDYQLLDGVTLSTHKTAHIFYPNNGNTITVDVDHLYTRYRRFNTSAHIIGDATQLPPQP